MNKLTQIILAKKAEVEQLKQEIKISEFEASTYFSRIGKSLKKSLSQSPGIITEFKRSSPSEGPINEEIKIQSVIRGYEKAGAAAISVLTDQQFFGGSIDDLVQARQITELPILRKDFIIDDFQVYESKAKGADVILLIAAVLEKEELLRLAELAKSINLEVLLEVHSEEELQKVNEFIDIIGVNNRDLSTFDVSLEQSKRMYNSLPKETVKISESGYTSPVEVYEMNKLGFQGFLIGSHFMKQENPAEAAAEFIKNLS